MLKRFIWFLSRQCPHPRAVRLLPTRLRTACRHEFEAAARSLVNAESRLPLRNSQRVTYP